MTATATVPQTTTWQLDPSHSSVEFSVKHLMIASVKGSFGKFEASLSGDDNDLSRGQVTVKIDTSSIDTGNEQRDGHLRSGDFFDAETYPEITFVSTGVERVDAESWRITGDLTIKDVTKPVSIDFESTGSAVDPFGNLRVGFEGETTINRKDWGLTWNAALETGGVLVSEKIKLEFDVSAIAVPAAS
jgi:polyisoprenoid-binding protein YceI